MQLAAESNVPTRTHIGYHRDSEKKGSTKDAHATANSDSSSIMVLRTHVPANYPILILAGMSFDSETRCSSAGFLAEARYIAARAGALDCAKLIIEAGADKDGLRRADILRVFLWALMVPCLTLMGSFLWAPI